MILYLRRKLNIKYAFAAFCILSVIIFLIDLKLIHELATKAFSCTLPVRGVHYTMGSFYVPDEYQKFKCITSDDVISFDKVNDDYCDCNDGSDEPGTAACPNGVFYCESDIYKRSAVPLPTNRVNDGICDCCDGSDEWQKINFPSAMPEHVQHLIGSYRTECPNEC